MAAWEKFLPQSSQLKGLLPVWLMLWRSRLWELVKDFVHTFTTTIIRISAIVVFTTFLSTSCKGINKVAYGCLLILYYSNQVPLCSDTGECVKYNEVERSNYVYFKPNPFQKHYIITSMSAI